MEGSSYLITALDLRLQQIRALDLGFCRDFVASEIAYQATYSITLLQSLYP